MPRTSLSGVRKLLGYASSLLSSGVRGNLTQTWAWKTFRAAQAAAGQVIEGVSGSDMSRLIGWVNKGLTARDNFAAADLTSIVDSSMIAPYATYLLSPGVALSPRTAITAKLQVTTTGVVTTVDFWLEADVSGLSKEQVLALVETSVTQAKLQTPTVRTSWTLRTATALVGYSTLIIYNI